MGAAADTSSPLRRYELLERLGSGGMASVHLGRMRGATGFRRLVAIKQLHPHLAADRAFVEMFIDEARLAAQIRHAHVVSTIDVVVEDSSIAIVMDYIEGISLSEVLNLVGRDGGLPIPVAVGIIAGVLQGLHAAHEAVREDGSPMNLVHRDVSLSNVLIGTDGVARLLDFGVAKAAGRIHSTADSSRLKGTFAYMSPEHARGEELDRRSDIYSASVLLWECLTGRPLFGGAREPGVVLTDVLFGKVRKASALRAEVSQALDDVVTKGTSRDRNERFSSALEMAHALEKASAPASTVEIAKWFAHAVPDLLEKRRALALRANDPNRSGGRSHTSQEVEIAAAIGGDARDVTAEHTATSHSRDVVRATSSLRRLAAGALFGAGVVGGIVIAMYQRAASPATPSAAPSAAISPSPALAASAEPSATAAPPLPSATVHDVAPPPTARSHPPPPRPRATATRAESPAAPATTPAASTAQPAAEPSVDAGEGPRHRRPGVIPEDRK